MQDHIFINALKASKAGAAITAEAERRRFERRKELAAIMRDSDAEAAKQWPVLSKAIDTATEKHVAAERALKDTATALRRATIARSTMTTTLDYRRDAAAAELRAGANPAVAEFREFIEAEILATSKALRAIDHVTRGMFGKKTITTFTNKVGVLAKLASLREGRAFADSLALIAIDDEVPAMIAEWKSKLPSTGEPVRVGENTVRVNDDAD